MVVVCLVDSRKDVKESWSPKKLRGVSKTGVEDVRIVTEEEQKSHERMDLFPDRRSACLTEGGGKVNKILG